MSLKIPRWLLWMTAERHLLFGIFLLPWYLPPNFSSIQHSVWWEILYEEFQDGWHLWHQNRLNLEYLSLCVALILPTKFRFNPSLNFGEDIVYEFRGGCYGGHPGKQNGTITVIWISMWPGYILQSVQCDIWLWSRCHLYIFMMAVMADWHLKYRKGTILAILNLHVAPMHPAKFSFTPTFILRIRTTCAIL